MKNILENIAVTLVVIFSLTIIGLIVQYNLIEEESEEHFNDVESSMPKVTKQQKNTNYLQKLEGYSEVDVKVNPRKENKLNRVKVKSEMSQDKLKEIVKQKDGNSISSALDRLLN
jgi:hypothetical protein